MGSQTRLLQRLSETGVVPGCDVYPSPEYEVGLRVVRVLDHLRGLGDEVSEHEWDWLDGDAPTDRLPFRAYLASVRATLAEAERQLRELERVLSPCDGCDGTGFVDDVTAACGDPEHCTGWAACGTCEGTGRLGETW